MQTVQLQLPQKLQTDIDFLKSELADLKKSFTPKEPTRFVSRNYVANEMLHCNLTTVHNLTVRGILKKYQIGGRVLYVRREVENAIVPISK